MAFSAIDYWRELKEVGCTDDQAIVCAKWVEFFRDYVVSGKDLDTFPFERYRSELKAAGYTEAQAQVLPHMMQSFIEEMKKEKK